MRGGEDGLRLVVRNAQQTVRVAEDQVTGTAMTMPSMAIGTLTSPGPSLYGVHAVRHAGGVQRQIPLSDLFGVANCAVEHDTGDADLDRGGDHDLPEEGVGEVAAAVHDDHVPRSGQRERLVDHQVVAGAGS